MLADNVLTCQVTLDEVRPSRIGGTVVLTLPVGRITIRGVHMLRGQDSGWRLFMPAKPLKSDDGGVTWLPLVKLSDALERDVAAAMRDAAKTATAPE
jgi:hypothetical protein